MNNAKMWLVVPPAVGVPAFLGAVAVGSFAVHVAVVTNTSWVTDFLQGQPMGTGDAQASLLLEQEMETAKASYVIDGEHAGQVVTVILQDGTVTEAILQTDPILASAPADLPLIIDQ